MNLYYTHGCFGNYLSTEDIESYVCETCGDYNGTEFSFNTDDLVDIEKIKYLAWDVGFMCEIIEGILEQKFETKEYADKVKETYIEYVKSMLDNCCVKEI